MNIQSYKYRYMFLLLIAVVTAGILSTKLLAVAKTDSKDDVQSTAVPGPRRLSIGLLSAQYPFFVGLGHDGGAQPGSH